MCKRPPKCSTVGQQTNRAQGIRLKRYALGKLRSVKLLGGCFRSESNSLEASSSLQFLRFATSLIACSRVSSVSKGGEYGCLPLSITLNLSHSQAILDGAALVVTKSERTLRRFNPGQSGSWTGRPCLIERSGRSCYPVVLPRIPSPDECVLQVPHGVLG